MPSELSASATRRVARGAVTRPRAKPVAIHAEEAVIDGFLFADIDVLLVVHGSTPPS